MNRLSTASIMAVIATIILGLAFMLMPILNAPVLDTAEGSDGFVITDEGETVRESISAMSMESGSH